MSGQMKRHRNRRLLDHLYVAQDKLCASCGRPMYLPWKHREIENDQFYASVDHLEARFVGGPDDLRNKVAMHRHCNSRKNHRPPTGCERIFHQLVLVRLALIPIEEWYTFGTGPKATMGDVWPGEREKKCSVG